MGSKIHFQKLPMDPMGSKIFWNFTMRSGWIMDPILQLVERSSGIIYPVLGSTLMSPLIPHRP